MASFELVLPEFLISTGGEFEQTERLVHEGKGNTGSIELVSLHRQSDRVPMNEAAARIRINKLHEAAGWCFFADGVSPANICLEANVASRASGRDRVGNDTPLMGSISFHGPRRTRLERAAVKARKSKAVLNFDCALPV